MANDILFVGLDVHKKTISVATVLEKPGESCRYYGSVPNTPDALRRLCKKLQADDASLYFCYEAGPCGYGVQRLLTRLGHRCDVVAPTLIPRKAGDRVKNDRRDAMSLAQNLRAGHLTEVWVPDEAHEAMRELVRLQALAKRDIRRARQQLLSFLLRHGVHYPARHWSGAHRRWLADLTIASIMRMSVVVVGRFSRRHIVGCEQSSGPVSGNRPPSKATCTGLPATGDRPGRNGASSVMAGANSVGHWNPASAPESYMISTSWVAPASS